MQRLGEPFLYGESWKVYAYFFHFFSEFCTDCISHSVVQLGLGLQRCLSVTDDVQTCDRGSRLKSEPRGVTYFGKLENSDVHEYNE
jgi:hypothetical protein